MTKNIVLSAIVMFAIGCISNAQTTDEVRINQIGYLPYAIKYAVVLGSTSEQFEIKTADLSTTVFTGVLGREEEFTSADEIVRIADFTDLSTPGEYVVYVEDLGNSDPFKISHDLFVPLSQATIKAFYFNRASTELLAEHAGIYARAAGHPDTAVVVHPSAASADRPAGTIISTPYGWYDAGDYNKYIVNAGISTYTLLSAYETYPEYYDTLSWNIPESGNSIPDILDEALWNIKWIMSMQDSADGGVYNKTTTASFENTVPPAYATSTRYVVTKTTASTLDFAAIMAMTARIYKDYLPDLATDALEKAQLALTWAKANPNIPFSNPAAADGFPRISTGSYGDEHFEDEFAWCAAELYITTGDELYYPEIDLDNDIYDIPNSGSTRTLGLISLVVNRKKLTPVADTSLAKQKLINLIKSTKNNTIATAYRIPGEYFGWGGNGIYANRGMLLMQAFTVTGDPGYFNAGVSTLDYLLGKNATTYCFVTGTGSKSPMNPHHRISSSDGNTDPVPGMLVGGPNPGNLDDDCGASQYPSTLPARAYLDQRCSYTTNEVAINWYAPIAFLSGAIQYEYLKNFTDSFPSYIIVSAEKINLPYKAGKEFELILSTNMEWTLSTNETWIDISKMDGDSSSTVMISANEDNASEAERLSYIYVATNDIIWDSILVSQNGIRRSFTIEAEDYSNMFGLQTENTSDAGGGLNLGYVDVDDWVEYPVDISVEGMYEVVFRHAGMECNFDVYIDEVYVKNISLPSTGDWQIWTDGIGEIGFTEGEHTLKFIFRAIGLNLNRMDFTWVRELDNLGVENLYEDNIRIYPVPADKSITISTVDGYIDSYKLISLDGKMIIENSNLHSEQVNINVSDLQSGLYFMVVSINEKQIRKKIIIK